MPERKGPKALLLARGFFVDFFAFSATPTWLFTQLGDEHCGEVIGRVIDFSRILLDFLEEPKSRNIFSNENE